MMHDVALVYGLLAQCNTMLPHSEHFGDEQSFAGAWQLAHVHYYDVEQMHSQAAAAACSMSGIAAIMLAAGARGHLQAATDRVSPAG
jgi:hypothetical protein